MLIRLRQRRSLRRADAQVLQLPLTAPQPVDDLPQRLRPAQLTEQHADKLAPARKSLCVTLCIMFLHHPVKLYTRKQLQQLAEYATKYIHVEPSLGSLVLSPYIYQIRAQL